MWERLLKISLTLRQVKGSGIKERYFRTVQLLLWRISQPATLHESIPVSLEVIRPIFAICGVVVGFGVIGFLVENRSVVGKGLANICRFMEGLNEIWLPLRKIFNTRR